MKKIIAVLLSVCLMFTTTIYASDNIVIVGLNDKIEEFSREYEPILFSGRICVPHTFFLNDFGIYSSYNSDRRVLILYDFDHILTIDLASGSMQDENLKTYSGTAFYRGSQIYLPVQVISDVFGIKYSMLYGKVDILRIYNSKVKLSNDVFIDFAEFLYYKEEVSEVTPPVFVPEKVPDSVVSPNVDPNIDQKPQEIEYITDIYANFVSNITKEQIDLFEEGEINFFIDQSTFENQEILRYAYIKGHSIGIYVSNDTNDVNEYLNYINQQLFSILGTKTRTILLESDQISVDENLYKPVTNDFDIFNQSQIIKDTKNTLKINFSAVSDLQNKLSLIREQNINFLKIDEFIYW